VTPNPTVTASLRRGSDDVEAALDASCGALMTLQSMRMQAQDSAASALTEQVHVQHAIDSLRQAILELRMARRQVASAIALGFVIASPGARTSWARAPSTQRFA
jgi:hypothetical protein